MWWWNAVGAAALLAVLASCGEEPTRSAADRPMVLELGGNQPTIAEVLRRTAPRSAVEPPPEPEPRSEPAPRTEPPAPPRVQPDPPPPAFTTVPLPEGYTLIRLCREQLGDGGRWPEVAKLNGWSEADLKRLAVGTEVKLPTR